MTEKKVCVKCGVEFTPSKFNPKSIFCSPACQRSSYMAKYNKEGARRRGVLPKEPCPICNKMTNKWIRVDSRPDVTKVCVNCANKLNNGQEIYSELLSADDGMMHGRDWWIGRKMGRMEVVDIPFEPLCNGRYTDTEISLKCPIGHVFKKPVNSITAVCPECFRINEERKEAFSKVKFPYDATFDEWKKMWKKHTDCDLMEASENRWKHNKHFKVKARCWCGREFEPYWNDIYRKRITSCGCLYNSSQPNDEIFQLLSEKGIYAVQEYPIEGRFIDVYAPGVGLAIEFNGLRWHEERQDLEKYNICLRNGIKYLGIYEDEWEDNKERCKKLILENLGVNGVFSVDYGNLSFDQLTDTQKVQSFVDKYGFKSFKIENDHLVIGALHRNELIGVMSWGVDVSSGRHIFVGACVDPFFKINKESLYRLMWDWGKEFKGLGKCGAFAMYVDNRLNEASLFEVMGFHKIKEMDPVCYWIKGHKRLSVEPAEDLDKYKKLYGCGGSIWGYMP